MAGHPLLQLTVPELIGGARQAQQPGDTGPIQERSEPPWQPASRAQHKDQVPARGWGTESDPNREAEREPDHEEGLESNPEPNHEAVHRSERVPEEESDPEAGREPGCKPGCKSSEQILTDDVTGPCTR